MTFQALRPKRTPATATRLPRNSQEARRGPGEAQKNPPESFLEASKGLTRGLDPSSRGQLHG
eukprot:7144518-Pyramimonas_sp.AAC.1